MIYERSLINHHECFCANSYLSAHSADVLHYSGVLLRGVCKLTCAGHMMSGGGLVNKSLYLLYAESYSALKTRTQKYDKHAMNQCSYDTYCIPFIYKNYVFFNMGNVMKDNSYNLQNDVLYRVA